MERKFMNYQLINSKIKFSISSQSPKQRFFGKKYRKIVWKLENGMGYSVSGLLSQNKSKKQKFTHIFRLCSFFFFGPLLFQNCKINAQVTVLIRWNSVFAIFFKNIEKYSKCLYIDDKYSLTKMGNLHLKISRARCMFCQISRPAF